MPSWKADGSVPLAPYWRSPCHIARTERFDLVDRYKHHRIYRETLGPMLGRAAMLLRPAMLPDLDRMPGAWDEARVIWSQWDGYLSQPEVVAFRARLAERSCGRSTRNRRAAW